MKTILFKSLLFLLFILADEYAMTQVNIDTTYQTTYYQQKVTLFRLLPDTKREIIFLGNSITDIGEWAEIWQSKDVKNRGISSDNTFGVLARLDEVVSSKPKKIFIMIGINDIAKATPDNVIVGNYKRIIEQILSASPNTSLYFQSILPTNNDFKDFARHQNKDDHIRVVNAELKKLCAEKSITFVDLYSKFLDGEGKLDKQFTNDGLHLNGSGYMHWKKILIETGYMK